MLDEPEVVVICGPDLRLYERSYGWPNGGLSARRLHADIWGLGNVRSVVEIG